MNDFGGDKARGAVAAMGMLAQNDRDGVKPGESLPAAGKSRGEQRRPALHPQGGGIWCFLGENHPHGCSHPPGEQHDDGATATPLLHLGLARPAGVWGTAAPQPLPSPTGTATAPGFSCWKQCGSRRFLCSWPPHGPAGNTSYLLTLW